jgi:hypothetical protein
VIVFILPEHQEHTLKYNYAIIASHYHHWRTYCTILPVQTIGKVHIPRPRCHFCHSQAHTHTYTYAYSTLATATAKASSVCLIHVAALSLNDQRGSFD